MRARAIKQARLSTCAVCVVRVRARPTHAAAGTHACCVCTTTTTTGHHRVGRRPNGRPAPRSRPHPPAGTNPCNATNPHSAPRRATTRSFARVDASMVSAPAGRLLPRLTTLQCASIDRYVAPSTSQLDAGGPAATYTYVSIRRRRGRRRAASCRFPSRGITRIISNFPCPGGHRP